MKRENDKSDERRTHIRVKSRILLRFEPMESEEFQRLSGAGDGWAELPLLPGPSDLIRTGTERHIRTLRENQEPLAAVLDSIDKKLTLIMNLLTLGHEEENLREHLVDLSASGIAFDHGEPFPKGQNLRMDLVPFPSCERITTFGEVVRCTRKAEDKHRIAARFSWIRPDDQDRLVEHVFYLQTLQLKIRRKKREGDPGKR